MPTKITDLVEYPFDSLRKAWLGAFVMGAISVASPTGIASFISQRESGNYELRLSIENDLTQKNVYSARVFIKQGVSANRDFLKKRKRRN